VALANTPINDAKLWLCQGIYTRNMTLITAHQVSGICQHRAGCAPTPAEDGTAA